MYILFLNTVIWRLLQSFLHTARNYWIIYFFIIYSLDKSNLKSNTLSQPMKYRPRVSCRMCSNLQIPWKNTQDRTSVVTTTPERDQQRLLDTLGIHLVTKKKSFFLFCFLQWNSLHIQKEWWGIKQRKGRRRLFKFIIQALTVQFITAMVMKGDSKVNCVQPRDQCWQPLWKLTLHNTASFCLPLPTTPAGLQSWFIKSTYWLKREKKKVHV